MILTEAKATGDTNVVHITDRTDGILRIADQESDLPFVCRKEKRTVFRNPNNLLVNQT